MFWGLTLKANRKYTQTITKAFHLSQAALDITNSSEEPVQVILTSDNHNYILCTLRKEKVEQVALDLNFAEGDEISFTSQGDGIVHLSGYLMRDIEEDLLGDEEESETEEIQQNKSPGKEKKKKVANAALKKEPESVEEEGSSEDDSDFGDEDGEEEDELDDDDEEGESESEEEIKEPKPKQMKLDNAKQNRLENGQVQPQKKDKKEKKEQNKSPKNSERVVQGGVKIEDIKVGTGPEAKPGKKVQVYYEGRLKSNNKLFDSCKQGAGFKFALGRGEVIKGWDIGVTGMKVGGKRRFICPPNVAYGPKGSPPVIPPNSTLVFEVELKGVN